MSSPDKEKQQEALNSFVNFATKDEKEQNQEQSNAKENQNQTQAPQQTAYKSEFDELDDFIKNEEKEKKIAQSINQANANLNQHAQEAVSNLQQQEKIQEQIKEKQEEIQEFKYPKQKRDFLEEKLNGVEKNENLKECMENLDKQEEIKKKIEEKEAQIKENAEKKEQSSEQEKKQDNSAEQEDWNKKAKELELQHEKELERLKDEQSKLEANFNKAIDNLMNSDGITGVVQALQEMDRSLEAIMRQGKEESEVKQKQRAEKLELAFDSPKFKESVGDLVKELYKETKEVKSNLKDMEKERNSYVKLKETYEKEVKKGLDIKGYEKIKKMIGDIEKESPNFKNTYPKLHKKVNETLEKAKENILNKTKQNTQDKGREI